MADESRIGLIVALPDGRIVRWSGEEADAGNLLQDLSFSTATPGGFRELTCSLLRNLDSRDDEALFARVRAIGAGGRILWEGRMTQFPRQTGTSPSVSPGAVGFSSHLLDDSSFEEVYVDQSPNWEPPPNERRGVLLTTGYSVYDPSSSGGSGVTLTYRMAGAARPISEAWYDAGPGARIAAVAVKGQGYNMSATVDPAFVFAIFGTKNRDASGAVGTGNINGVGDPAHFYINYHPVPAQRYIGVQAWYAGTTAANPGLDRSWVATRTALYGDHGLPGHSTSSAEPAGFYASDVVANVVQRAAPMLTFTTGDNGTIQPTTFIIPHLKTDGPTTASDFIQRVNAYHGWDWLVWEGTGRIDAAIFENPPIFYYQPAGSGVVWHARRADGGQLQFEGDSAENLYNAVMVIYTDALTGVTKRAGWPGGGFDDEDPLLRSDDPDNPVNRVGIPTKNIAINPSFPTTREGAIELGALALAGQITLQSAVRHPSRGYVPVAEVRAGDSIVFDDIPDDLPRRIVETSYSHASRTLTATVNNSANKVEALLERILAWSNLVPGAT
jgi:hypothetical protein